MVRSLVSLVTRITSWTVSFKPCLHRLVFKRSVCGERSESLYYLRVVSFSSWSLTRAGCKRLLQARHVVALTCGYRFWESRTVRQDSILLSCVHHSVYSVHGARVWSCPGGLPFASAMTWKQINACKCYSDWEKASPNTLRTILCLRAECSVMYNDAMCGPRFGERGKCNCNGQRTFHVTQKVAMRESSYCENANRDVVGWSCTVARVMLMFPTV